MKRIIKNWYNISVFIAGALSLILALGSWDLKEKTLLASAVIIFLHFFEEFGFPGGFPWVGMRVERGIKDTDTKNWPFNQAAAMWGNFCFAVLVYIMPLFLPDIRFLTLAAVIFAFAEVLMHAFVFNIALKDYYNPGLLTAVFGLLPVSVFYLIKTWEQQLYTGADLAAAIAWIVFNYWLSFLSPVYKQLLKLNDQYAFTADDVLRAERYISRCK
ncbi:MAG: HXXEE domain-containing protein [Bariatricus sp.]